MTGAWWSFMCSPPTAPASRTWPAPAVDHTGVTNTTCNALYVVDGSVIAGDLPLYRLVLTAADRTSRPTSTPTPAPRPFPSTRAKSTTRPTAMPNSTPPGSPATGPGGNAPTRPPCAIAGTAADRPSRKVSPCPSPHATPWNGRTDFNLNSQHTPYQLVGSDLFRAAGLAMAESRAVHVRFNAANPAGTGSPSYGFYSCNEAMDSEFAAHHFPQDSGGNLYQALRVLHGTTPGGTVVNAADLGHVVPAPGETLSQAELYQLNYFKHTGTNPKTSGPTSSASPPPWPKAPVGPPPPRPSPTNPTTWPP